MRSVSNFGLGNTFKVVTFAIVARFHVLGNPQIFQVLQQTCFRVFEPLGVICAPWSLIPFESSHRALSNGAIQISFREKSTRSTIKFGT